ncbi:unnamed protein product [Cuscuta epithymum]|uniref:DUF3615 domain-containing protein n=1 Tax=Cuscuta epithymum TaxID=186058 RepID=A0AAV0F4G3_9ASTE|nr:unnamed protein product [Cuscuta epithymum]
MKTSTAMKMNKIDSLHVSSWNKAREKGLVLVVQKLMDSFTLSMVSAMAYTNPFRDSIFSISDGEFFRMRILYSDDEEESNWEMSDGELERVRAMLSADLTYEKSELYPGPGWSLNCPRAPVDPQILIQRALEQKTELTELALKFYNIIHNTSYELVEALKCLVVFPEEHYHLNFTAKLPDGPDTSPKLFFAELQEDEGFYDYEGEENRLTACVIMKQGEGKRSCASCSEVDGLLHPLDGFCYGKPSVMANTNPFRRPLSAH